MKRCLLIVLAAAAFQCASAQNWNLYGNSNATALSFIGTTNNKPLVFRTNNIERGRLTPAGTWRFGTAAGYAMIDAGKLSFGGTGAYLVADNKYVFQSATNANYGLFFNTTLPQYEFRNAAGLPVLSINSNNGNGVFAGTLRIGAYTLPSTDGTNGQVLTTNGGGAVSWASVAPGNTYTAGTGIAISGNTISNTSPNIPVTLTGSGTTTISGTYPNFTVASTDNDAQTLSLSGNNLSISNGNSVALPQTVYTAGNSIDITNNVISVPYLKTDGNSNTAVGQDALFSNTTGFGNTVNGVQALFSNTGGYDNTVNGMQALFSNTTGESNTANGKQALYLNTTGNYGTANGAYALYSNTTGDYNVANGCSALFFNTTGSNNVANGYNALFFNTTGSNVGPAKIIITDKSGRQLKQLNLSGAGKGTVTVDASLLASGAYNYSLYVDGKLVATKQMELLK